jgi:thiol-disulfide isomerase/thioredoxin
MSRKLVLLILAPALLTAADFNGKWDGAVITPAARVPFRMDVNSGKVCFFEDTESVCSTSMNVEGDKLTALWDYMNTRLTLTSSGGALAGTYVNQRTQRVTQIEATPHKPAPPSASPAANFGGEWEVHSEQRPGPGEQLILRQSDSELKGTILRVDGDDGTLVGAVSGKQFAISHFSGDRPVLLKGTMEADGTLQLQLGAQKLVAMRPAEARKRNLTPPLDPMTFAHVRNPQERFHFNLKDVNGKNYTEDTFAGKPYVVSITGSWCPNCRDEAPFLAELYQQYHAKGLQMAAFCFESATDPTWAPLKAFVRKYNIQYPALLAGEPSAESLHTAVPQIENLSAYPTTIYVGKDGKVRSVHTGFPSSGSGEELTRVKEEIRHTIEDMLK